MSAVAEFRAGLDLGQVNDSSALVIIEEIEHPTHDPSLVHETRDGPRLLLPDGRYGDVPPDDEPSYDVRHVMRWKLGTPYPKIVDDVVTMMMAKPLLGECPLVVDATGVGRPVIDMFHEHKRWDFPLTPVVITSGQHVTHDKGFTHVPKRDLVSTVQVLLQSRRLRFPQASKLPEVATLVRELGSFQVKVTTAANDIYGAWREGAHDDLVLGLALVTWYAERCQWRTLA